MSSIEFAEYFATHKDQGDKHIMAVLVTVGVIGSYYENVELVGQSGCTQDMSNKPPLPDSLHIWSQDTSG